MIYEPNPISASSVALARIDHLSSSMPGMVDARGVETRELAPDLILETFPRVDVHWRRLLRGGTRVLDATTVAGLVRCHAFIPGPWLAWLGHAAPADDGADAPRLHAPTLRDRNDGAAEGEGRIPIPGKAAPPRRAAVVDLATLAVARGRRMAADPGIRLAWFGGHSAAVGHAAGIVLLSVHTSGGAEIVTAAMDRSPPHALRWTRGHRDLRGLSQLLSPAAWCTVESRAAFHDFCERSD